MSRPIFAVMQQRYAPNSFGLKFAAVNLSLLYTARGASAFLVPVANIIKANTGSWHMVFVITGLLAQHSACVLLAHLDGR